MNRRQILASKFIYDIWSTSTRRSSSSPLASCAGSIIPAFASTTFHGVSHFHTLLHCPGRSYRPPRTRPSILQCYASFHEEKSVESLQGYNLNHKECNVPVHIAARVGTNIHLQLHHPLNIIKKFIENYWQQRGSKKFHTLDTLSPIVTTYENFDSLLIPPNHISRTRSDTYYLREDTLLRTHTSAHQMNLLKQGLDQFLVTGDVYRFVFLILDLFFVYFFYMFKLFPFSVKT